MINQVINIVREASKLMTSDITIEQKGNDSNFVTSADVNVQHFLEERLLNLIPESTFLGEEEGKQAVSSEYIWVVDPIDGTANFIRGLGASAISVGLVKGCKPYLGVIYEPYKDEMYYAELGKGAFLNGKRQFLLLRGKVDLLKTLCTFERHDFFNMVYPDGVTPIFFTRFIHNAPLFYSRSKPRYRVP